MEVMNEKQAYWDYVHREAMKLGWRLVSTDDPSSIVVTEDCKYCNSPCWDCGCQEWECITDFGRYS